MSMLQFLLWFFGDLMFFFEHRVVFLCIIATNLFTNKISKPL